LLPLQHFILIYDEAQRGRILFFAAPALTAK